MCDQTLGNVTSLHFEALVAVTTYSVTSKFVESFESTRIVHIMKATLIDSSGSFNLCNTMFGFPHIEAPFWNRQCVGFAAHLQASSVVPPVELTSSDIRAILMSLSGSGGHHSLAVRMTHIPERANRLQQFQLVRSFYTLTTGETHSSRLSLSIPIISDPSLCADTAAER